MNRFCYCLIAVFAITGSAGSLAVCTERAWAESVATEQTTTEQATAEQDIAERFAAAEALLRRDEYAEAAEQFRALAAAELPAPWARKAEFRAAEASLFAGEQSTAIRLLSAFRATRPNDPLNDYVASYLAEAYFDTQQYAEAIEPLEHLLRLPTDTLKQLSDERGELLAKLVLCQAYGREFAAARVTWAQLAEQPLDESRRQTLRSTLRLLATEQGEQAWADELADHDALLYQQAWQLQAAGQFDEAAHCFEQIRQQWPESRYWPDAVYRLAERALAAGDFSRARQLAKSLLEQNEAAALRERALYLMAQSYWSQAATSQGKPGQPATSQTTTSEADWSEAAVWLQRLLAEYPEGSLALAADYFLAESLLRRQQPEEALVRLSALVRRLPERPEPWMHAICLRQAQLLARERRWSEALRAADAAERMLQAAGESAAAPTTGTPGSALPSPVASAPGTRLELLETRGRILVALGEIEAARESLRQLVDRATTAQVDTAAQAQWMIGETYFLQRDYVQAIREYRRLDVVFADSPWRAAGLLQEAKCHDLLGQHTQAVELYARLIKQFPESRHAALATERLTKQRR